MAITRTSWTDGTTVINNSQLQGIYDAVENTWALDTYTPSWTASTSNPSLGNGTSSGKYISIGGKCIVFVAKVTSGSTTTYGTGNYSFSLPLSADTTYPGLILCYAQDSSAGGAIHQGHAFISTSTTALLLLNTEAAGVAAAAYTPTAPITFATGDSIFVVGVYFRT